MSFFIISPCPLCLCGESEAGSTAGRVVASDMKCVHALPHVMHPRRQVVQRLGARLGHQHRTADVDPARAETRVGLELEAHAGGITKLPRRSISMTLAGTRRNFGR